MSRVAVNYTLEKWSVNSSNNIGFNIVMKFPPVNAAPSAAVIEGTRNPRIVGPKNSAKHGDSRKGTGLLPSSMSKRHKLKYNNCGWIEDICSPVFSLRSNVISHCWAVPSSFAKISFSGNSLVKWRQNSDKINNPKCPQTLKEKTLISNIIKVKYIYTCFLKR